jgi:hypothetical protein
MMPRLAGPTARRSAMMPHSLASTRTCATSGWLWKCGVPFAAMILKPTYDQRSRTIQTLIGSLPRVGGAGAAYASRTSRSPAGSARRAGFRKRTDPLCRKAWPSPRQVRTAQTHDDDRVAFAPHADDHAERNRDDQRLIQTQSREPHELRKGDVEQDGCPIDPRQGSLDLIDELHLLGAPRAIEDSERVHHVSVGET